MILTYVQTHRYAVFLFFDEISTEIIGKQMYSSSQFGHKAAQRNGDLQNKPTYEKCMCQHMTYLINMIMLT